MGPAPAGLTAGYELLTKTDILPLIIEADKQVGGLTKTIESRLMSSFFPVKYSYRKTVVSKLIDTFLFQHEMRQNFGAPIFYIKKPLAFYKLMALHFIWLLHYQILDFYS